MIDNFLDIIFNFFNNLSKECDLKLERRKQEKLKEKENKKQEAKNKFENTEIETKKDEVIKETGEKENAQKTATEAQKQPENPAKETPKETEKETLKETEEKEGESKMEIDKTHKSPNFSSRNNTKIDTIIIHHTGGNDGAKSLKWFEMKDSGVSAHYMIDRDGTIYQLVEEDKTAWHAGVSWLPQEHDKTWGKGSVNPRSIGIELVNLGDGKTEFPKAQMDSLKALVASLKKKYNVDNDHILGHREVAPGRKTDPADNFDWSALK